MIALYISEKAVRKEIEDKPDVDISLCNLTGASQPGSQPQLTIYGVAVLDGSLVS